MVRRNIPNLLTCLNLTCGVLAILIGNLDLGVYLIVLGGIFDVFDGMVARALKVSSTIGGELDSLADLVSFGVAPAVLFYKAFAVSGQWYYFVGVIIIVVAGAVRLARFNVSDSKTDYFEGLAIPASGLMFCGLVYARDHLEVLTSSLVLFMAICFLLAFLNVSKVRMFSFKQFALKRVKFYFALIALIGIAALFLWPRLFLVSIIGSYIAIAIVNSLFQPSK